MHIIDCSSSGSLVEVGEAILPSWRVDLLACNNDDDDDDGITAHLAPDGY